jgi:hypothetical protein
MTFVADATMQMVGRSDEDPMRGVMSRDLWVRCRKCRRTRFK